MPWGDRTGPSGFGPMTGRAAGYCAGYPVPGYMNPAQGFGLGFGRGWRGGGRGWRHMYYATGVPGWARSGYGAPGVVPPVYGGPTKEQEMGALKTQADLLQQQLEEINRRLEELGTEEE